MSPRRTRVLAACGGTHATQDGLTASIYVLLPVLAQSLSLGFAQVGAIRAVHGAAMWLLELPAGIASERVGERRLLVFGLLAAGAGYVCLSLAAGFQGVVLALFIAGCGAAFQHSLCSSLVSRTFEGAGLRRALGVYNSSGDSGKLLFTSMVGALIGLGVHWQAIAVGYGTVAIVAGLTLWLVLRRVRAGGARKRFPAGAAPRGGADWGIRHRGGFTALGAIVTIDIAVQDGFLVFVTFVMLAKDVPPALAAFAVTLTLVGGIAGKLGCGMLAARLGPVLALVLVEILTACGIVAVLLVPGPGALLVLPALGVVLQGSSTITYGTVSDLVRPDRLSRGFALVYTMSASASMLGPVGFGLASDSLGLDGALWVMAFLVLLPLPLTLGLRRGLRSAPGAASGTS